MHALWPRLLASTAAALLVAGCGGDSPTSGSAPPPDSARPARTLPLPGAGAPTEPRPSAGGPGAGLLVWDVPAGWVVEQPGSPMRLAQYRVSGPAGDAECVVYYFGPGQGGDATSNALRWAGQFEQPDGRSSVDVMQVTPLATTGVSVQIVELTGTYDGGMTMTDVPAEARAGHMLLGAIAEGPDAPWFFKLTGPEATVRAQKDALLQMMRSVRVGA